MHMFAPTHAAKFLTIAVVFTAAQVSQAAIHLTENWENPVIASPGGTTETLPSGWQRNGGGTNDSVLVRPTDATFNQAGPLEAPAGGNQALRLTGTNVGVALVTTVTIQANTVYTLEAAIGNDISAAQRNDTWSLQLWATSNGFDTFIGQQFGTNPGAINPAAGEWALNSYSFNSASTPGLVGQRLIIFLNNFDVRPDVGQSYYDNVQLSSEPATAAVPEPGTLTSWGLGVLGCAFAAYRRKRLRA